MTEKRKGAIDEPACPRCNGSGLLPRPPQGDPPFQREYQQDFPCPHCQVCECRHSKGCHRGSLDNQWCDPGTKEDCNCAVFFTAFDRERAAKGQRSLDLWRFPYTANRVLEPGSELVQVDPVPKKVPALTPAQANELAVQITDLLLTPDLDEFDRASRSDKRAQVEQILLRVCAQSGYGESPIATHHKQAVKDRDTALFALRALVRAVDDEIKAERISPEADDAEPDFRHALEVGRDLLTTLCPGCKGKYTENDKHTCVKEGD